MSGRLETAGGDDSRHVSLLFGVLFAAAALGTASTVVVLGDMAAALGVPEELAAWAISLHALTMAVATLIYGRLTDLRGPRSPLLVGVFLMCTGALVASTAASFQLMIAARLVQGAGAAAVPTIGMAVLANRYADEVRAVALGRLAAVVAAATASGAFIGGVVEAVAGWRLVMALPLLGLLALPGLLPALGGVGSGQRPDLVGAALVALTSGGLILLVQSPSAGLSAVLAGVALLVTGTPSAVRWVRRRPDGFLPLPVITHPTVTRASFAAASVPLAWLAAQVAIPLVLVARGWAPWQVGLLLLPSAVFAFVTPRLAGPMLARRGAFTTLRIAACMASLALVTALAGALALGGAPALGAALLLLAMVVVSIAFGLSQPAIGVAASAAVEPGLRGVALGVVSLVNLLAASLGAAAISGIGSMIGIQWTLATLAVVPLAAALSLMRLGGLTATDPPPR